MEYYSGMRLLATVLVGFLLLFAPLCSLSPFVHTHGAHDTSAVDHLEMSSAVTTALFKTFFVFFCVVLSIFLILQVRFSGTSLSPHLSSFFPPGDRFWFSLMYHAPPLERALLLVR